MICQKPARITQYCIIIFVLSEEKILVVEYRQYLKVNPWQSKSVSVKQKSLHSSIVKAVHDFSTNRSESLLLTCSTSKQATGNTKQAFTIRPFSKNLSRRNKKAAVLPFHQCTLYHHHYHHYLLQFGTHEHSHLILCACCY